VSKEATLMLTLEILIPTVWLTVAAFVIVLCSVSARGDDNPEGADTPAPWIKVGALELHGGAGESRASGESVRGQAPEKLVRELSGT